MQANRVFGVLMIAAVCGGVMAGCESTVEKNRNAGIKLYKSHDDDAALTRFDAALKADAFDAQSNAYAGRIYYDRGQYEQASYSFKTALQADPSSEPAKAGLTASLIKLDKPDLALDYLERASAMADKVKDPRWEKSISKRPYMKQTEENLYVGKGGDRLRIAKVYEQLGDFDNAAVYYKKALAMDKDNIAALMDLGMLYEKGGNKDQAKACFIEAYHVNPADPDVQAALTRNNVLISDAIKTK